MKRRLCWLSIALGVLGLSLPGSTALGSPYFLISSQAEWEEALGGGGGGGSIRGLDPLEWDNYMLQWDTYGQGEPYPTNVFQPPDLYVYGGGGGGGINDPEGPGLVMAWGDSSLEGSYSSAWRYEYGLDPDLSNTVITITVLAPQFDHKGNQINVVSFGMQGPPGGLMGPIRSWSWNVGGPGNPIQWNVPTPIIINNSILIPPGVNSTIPPASGFANNPMFNIANVLSFIVDENAVWVGGETPVPPPGQTMPRMWNYWQNLVVASGQGEGLDFGDAPEGATAYPVLGVIGRFPTCKTVTLASWIQHTNFGAVLGATVPGPIWDPEADGNAGLCPVFTPNSYDRDECFNDGDAGLIRPPAYTIQGLQVMPCAGQTGSLGIVCQQANWGPNIDVLLTNNMPSGAPGYLNVLIDWDQSGFWGGASQCPTAFTPEHVLVNFQIPNGYSGPVSGVAFPQPPPAFLIGPNPGFVWMRVSFTERPVPANWDGSGSFEDGETEDYLIQIDPHPQEGLDFGDAPDNLTALGYPTLLVKNGARHVIVSGAPWLGDATDTPDAEPDGQPDPSALGDDNDTFYPPPNDDEDGVTIPVPMIVGQPATILVQVGSAGWVDAWVDWNGNKAWEDPAERIWGGPMPAGPNAISVVPPGPFVGQTFGRFRIHTDNQTALLPTGQANDGEVEDHEVFIEEGQERLDFGDAPDPNYPTLLVNDGARHMLGSGLMLGNLVDAEADGQPTTNADGDDLNPPMAIDDEDGVTFNTALFSGVPNTVTVVVTEPSGGQAILDAWIDFDGNGSWAEAGEQIFTSVLVSSGVNNLTFTPGPITAVGQTFARFRLSYQGGLSYTGQAPDGEVEDYVIQIAPVKWLQRPDTDWTGVDVEMSEVELADDFMCTMSGPITDLHIWTSFEYDEIPQPLNSLAFKLTLYTDVPVGPENPYSHPGEPVWSRTFPAGTYNAGLIAKLPQEMGEWWHNPLTGLWVYPGDWSIFQYDFYIPLSEAFVQREGRIYWLGVKYQSDLTFVRMGWKSSLEHWNDDAVWLDPTSGIPTWRELRYGGFDPRHPMAPESMDLAFAVTGEPEEPPDEDFGDAPDPPYPTLLPNGASHTIVPGMFLGNLIDAEPNGQPDPNAMGDDLSNQPDEDGVVFLNNPVRGQMCRIQVTASMSGMLDAWVDFNGANGWADPGEQIFASWSLNPGPNLLQFMVPATAQLGPTFARFRYSSAGGLPYTGWARDGEVEDYQIRIYLPVTPVNWTSTRLHATNRYGITLDPVDANPPTSEPRMDGTNPQLAIVFAQADGVTPVDLTDLNVGYTAGQVVITFAGADTDGLTYTESFATTNGPNDTLVLTLSSIVDRSCYKFDVSNSVALVSGADATCSIVNIIGDSNNSRTVTVSDVAQVRTANNQPVFPSNIRRDFNLSDSITVSDVALARTKNNSNPIPCP